MATTTKTRARWRRVEVQYAVRRPRGPLMMYDADGYRSTAAPGMAVALLPTFDEETGDFGTVITLIHVGSGVGLGRYETVDDAKAAALRLAASPCAAWVTGTMDDLQAAVRAASRDERRAFSAALTSLSERAPTVERGDENGR